MLEGFESRTIDTGETTIFVRRAGSGPPVLLLHGFPETHLMWRGVAPLLARRFTVVCADLRGYGRSGCPAVRRRSRALRQARHGPRHGGRHGAARPRALLGRRPRSRRPRRLPAGARPPRPDRATRRARHPPDRHVWERADARLALNYWPWSLLAQPEPLPERLWAPARRRGGRRARRLGLALVGLRAPSARGLRRGAPRPGARPRHLRGVPRRGTLDRDHDHADRARRRRIACPVLALWGDSGAARHLVRRCAAARSGSGASGPATSRGTGCGRGTSSLRRSPPTPPSCWAGSSRRRSAPALARSVHGST